MSLKGSEVFEEEASWIRYLIIDFFERFHKDYPGSIKPEKFFNIVRKELRPTSWLLSGIDLLLKIHTKKKRHIEGYAQDLEQYLSNSVFIGDSNELDTHIKEKVLNRIV